MVLAYSGGLDTSVAIGWIAEQTGAEVIALAVDVGQGGEDLDTHPRRGRWPAARPTPWWWTRGRSSRPTYCLPALKANALYMDRYPLVSALSRPLIVDAPGPGGPRVRRQRGRARLHRQGQRPGAVRGGPGQPGPGGERARPGPRLRHDQGQGDRVRGGEGPADRRHVRASPYSIDQNLWGRAVETGHLEDIWKAPHDDVYDYTSDPAVPREPDELVLTFTDGVPVAIDGRR